MTKQQLAGGLTNRVVGVAGHHLHPQWAEPWMARGLRPGPRPSDASVKTTAGAFRSTGAFAARPRRPSSADCTVIGFPVLKGIRARSGLACAGALMDPSHTGRRGGGCTMLRQERRCRSQRTRSGACGEMAISDHKGHVSRAASCPRMRHQLDRA
jgi:hypothetical protein